MPDAATLIVWPILMGLVGVGAVILIKTRRRLQGTHDSRHTDVVPVNQLSPARAHRMWRRYLLIAGIVMAGLVLVLLVLSTGRS